MPRRTPTINPELKAHQEWLGYLQPVGLVVAPAAMVDAGWVVTRSGSELIERQERYREAIQGLSSASDCADPEPETDGDTRTRGFPQLEALLVEHLGWSADQIQAAQGPLEKAVVLQPRNPFALRTLGQLYLMKGNQKAALPHLRSAATVAPEDPINLFTYAQGLLAIEGGSNEAEADELFQRALRLAPTGELAEKIKQQQRRLAERVLRTNAQGQPRMDAVMYLSSALETYRELDPAGQKQLLGEVAAVGQQGLALNNPEPKHHLQHYRGGSIVSGLQAACILYVGVQLLLPGVEQGRVALLDAQISVLLKSVDQRCDSDSALRLKNHAKTA